jgi:hypothetical protein
MFPAQHDNQPDDLSHAMTQGREHLQQTPAGTPLPAAEEARLRESMTRLYEIYRGISEKAAQVIVTRCPYKNAQSRCTANFGCRNQFVTKVPGALPVCAGSDKLDYRSAWDV